jgi:hypothetical protein
VEIHIKGNKMRKKQSVTPYCAKQHKPKGEEATTKRIRAYTIGRQAHNRGKSTSSLGDTTVDHVTMMTRGDPPKMGSKGTVGVWPHCHWARLGPNFVGHLLPPLQ